MADLTPASIEVLAAQRRVIEQVREMAFRDQIGEPIPQDAMTRLLEMAEEQAVERHLARPATPDPLREALEQCRNDLIAYGSHLSERGRTCPRLPGEPCACGFDDALARASAALGQGPYTARDRASLARAAIEEADRD